MAREHIPWTGSPKAEDDDRFLAVVNRLVDRLSPAADVVDIRVVRIDNWFGPKWLGFAGKVLGALSVHKVTTRADLVVPPFTPGRVVWERHFAVNDDGHSLVESLPLLHREQTSSANLGRKLAEFSSRAHFVWFSGNSRGNGRGSVMVASLHDAEQDAYYVGFTHKEGGWRVGDVAGNPPTPPAAVLTEAGPSEMLVFGDARLTRSP